MEPDDLTLWRQSAVAWVRHGRDGDQSRRMLDPHVWDALGPLGGLQVLDVGCGEGRFGRVVRAAVADPDPERQGESDRLRLAPVSEKA